MQSINPATAQIIQTYPDMSDLQAASIVEATHLSFLRWKQTSFKERTQKMRTVAQRLRNNKDSYARLITAEMGKVYSQAIAEIEKCAWVCEYYAENAANFLADESIATEARQSFISYQPLGLVLGIMPWNFPFWQVFRFAVPTLMAGNGVLLKHAQNVCGSALAIETIFKDAGFPGNLFRTLLLPAQHVAKVIENKHVQAVTLTGSVVAGKAVAAKAGACLKKTVLELGGSDAYVILQDADVENAAQACVISRLNNAGQSCVAAKRFIVVEEVAEEFIDSCVQKMKAVSLGDPMDAKTDMGPLAAERFRDHLHQQVLDSIALGAKCILGGVAPERTGFFYTPTILVDVKPGMPAYGEELFGPVASIITVKDEAEAIAVANSVDFGLGGAVFTQDTAKGLEIARTQMETGVCFVNDFVKSDPRLPFGGVKESGYGRELSIFGIREFVNVKTVVLK